MLLTSAAGCRSVACPAIWREAAAKSGNSVCQRDRIRRVYCRSPADRGQARSYAFGRSRQATRSRLLILAVGRRSVACPAIWREAAVKSGNSVCQRDRIRRVCCRSPADRGTSHAPTPSAEADQRHVSTPLILAAGRTTHLNAFDFCLKCRSALGLGRIRTIWREAAVKSGNLVCQQDRIRRVCCRCPADRGTSHAPTPSAEAGKRHVLGP